MDRVGHWTSPDRGSRVRDRRKIVPIRRRRRRLTARDSTNLRASIGGMLRIDGSLRSRLGWPANPRPGHSLEKSLRLCGEKGRGAMRVKSILATVLCAVAVAVMGAGSAVA